MSNGYGYIKKCKPSAPVKTEKADLRGVSYDRNDSSDTFRDLGNTQDRISYDRDDSTDTYRDLGNTQEPRRPIDPVYIGGYRRKRSRRRSSRRQRSRRQ